MCLAGDEAGRAIHLPDLPVDQPPHSRFFTLCTLWTWIRATLDQFSAQRFIARTSQYDP
jgi:hypothetical protein